MSGAAALYYPQAPYSRRTQKYLNHDSDHDHNDDDAVSFFQILVYFFYVLYFIQLYKQSAKPSATFVDEDFYSACADED